LKPENDFYNSPVCHRLLLFDIEVRVPATVPLHFLAHSEAETEVTAVTVSDLLYSAVIAVLP
jgi:hypothetical protein